jgi:autotransporter translocation and assembly factor TamB
MKRLIRILALVGTLIVGAASLTVIVTQTPWFKDWLRGYIVRQANQYLNGQLSIGRLGGNLFFGVEVVDVAVMLGEQRVITVKDVGIDYSVIDFATRGIVLDDIRLNGPVIRLVREGEGWNLGRLVKEQRREADREGPALPVTIGEVGISDGTFTIEGAAGTGGVTLPERFERINASAGFLYEPVRYTVNIGHLSFRTAEPDLALNELSGRIAVASDAVHVEKLTVRTAESSLQIDGVVRDYMNEPAFNLTASSDKLALDEIARVVPALAGYTLQPAFEVRASGPLHALRLELQARSSAGAIDANMVADVARDRPSFQGRVEMRGLDLAPLLRNPAQQSDITGRADVDLRFVEPAGSGPLAGLDGTWRIDAPSVAIMGYAARDVTARGRFEKGVIHLDGRAAAYGGRATATGSVTPGEALGLNLRGDASNVDLRNLPRQLGVPRAPSSLNVSYQIAGRLGTPAGRDLTASVLFRRSRFAGAGIGDGSTARVRLAGRRTEYAADAHVQALDLQRVGAALGIDALDADRYQTHLNGRITVDGSGTTLDTMNLAANGTLEDSTALGGRLPALHFEATVRDGGASLRADGTFAGFNPAAVSGREDMEGQLAGTLNVEATLRDLGAPLTPESLSASGRVSLTDSRVAGLQIDRLALDGTFDQGAGTVRSLELSGPDLTLSASGPLDLRAGGGHSNLEYRADIGRLDAVPLSGTAQIEGRVAGNGDELRLDGQLKASNVKYAEHSVLSANTSYGVRLPQLSAADAEVSVNGTATLLQIAGQQLNALELDATWRQPSVRFKTTLVQGERTVTAAGDVVLHPDHQEIHLGSFGLRTNDVAWETAPGAEAAVRYGNGRVEIDNLHLVSGGQQLLAAGSIGGENAQLHIDARNVDLAAVDQLALGERRFGGTLTANATVSGTFDAPQVEARFDVRGGSFREYRYESLNGTVNYTTAGIRLDTRLTQTPAAWITAKGFVPAAMFRPSTAPSDAGVHRDPPPGESLDVLVSSSELDLALVQGFIPQLSRVAGTLQAEIRATGEVSDPHLSGFVEIRNGAFTVADLTKGGYTGLDTRITLQPDRVLVERLRILDEHENWLEIDGQIAVHEREVGDVQIALRSNEFEIIDNELADIKVNTDLRIAGRLQQPRVEGTVAVHTGTVHVGRVLSQLTTDAYALEPTEIETAPQAATNPSEGATAVAEAGTSPKPGAAPEAPAEPAGGLFQALTLDVALTVPNNLVIRGEDLNPSGASPVGLGDVNVTVGGEIRARKTRGADLTLVGTVNTVRGTYDFQGRRFEIQRDGRIQFTGGTPIDPRLDITAIRVISGVEALVHVRGTARAPELTLSSRPPLDEADILSLIVFNQPVNALGEGQQISLAERAGALATGFVASSLASSIGGALELDVFEIQTTAESGGGGMLTVGEQVGERLFVRFRQGFGAEATSEFILEYQLADFLRLQTSLAEGGTATRRTLMRRVEQGGIDLIFFFAY